MTPWTAVVIYTRYRHGDAWRTHREPLPIGRAARESLLVQWAEAGIFVSRGLVLIARVTDAEGRELTPSQVDWSGMTSPPRRADGSSRAEVRPRGHATTTGRATADAAQVLVRLSADEAARIDAARGETSRAEWMRETALAHAATHRSA